MATPRYHTDHSVLSILGLERENTPSQTTGPPRHRQRRNRTMFSDQAVRALELMFDTNPYPDIGMREQIAAELNITESRIQVWFQKRRSRKRKITGPSRKSTKVEKPVPVIPTSGPSKSHHYQQQPTFFSPYMFGLSPLYQSQPQTAFLDYQRCANVLPFSTPWPLKEHPAVQNFIPKTSPRSCTARDVKCQPEVSSTTSTPTKTNECIQRELSKAETRQIDVNQSKSSNSTYWDSGTSFCDKCSAADEYLDIAMDLSTRIRS